jgi:hypothetical protein
MLSIKKKIKILVVKDDDGFVREVSIRGHAGYSRRGRDIVCAAVSVLAYTLAGAIEEFTGVKNYIEKDGYMKIIIDRDSIPTEKIDKAKTIAETVIFGLQQTAQSYKEYINIFIRSSMFDKEVNSND